MHVVYDGIIFESNPHRGIARIFGEIIPRLCTLAPQAQIDIFSSKLSRRALPQRSNLHEKSIIDLSRYLRPYRLFGMMNPSVRELELSLISHTQNSIWHSTYFTQPAYWRGHKVLTVYDMIYELLPEFFGQKFDELFCSRKKRLIEDADIVVCISETTRQDIAHLY